MLLYGASFLVLVVSMSGGTSTKLLRDPSFFRLLNNHHSGINSPTTSWIYGSNGIAQKYQTDSQQHYSPEDTARNYISQWHGSGVKTVPYRAISSGHISYSPSSQEYWTPNYYTTWTAANHTKTGLYKPSLIANSSTPSYSSIGQDAIEGSHSMFQYQHTRPMTTGPLGIKKFPTYHLTKQSQYKGTESTGKRYKKTPILYYALSNYKQTVYPRVHKPYVKHKYPARKTVHPFYRRYYQSPYQQYPVSSGDFTSFKHKKQNGIQQQGYYKVSEPTTATTHSIAPVSRYPTTERMDDNYPATSEEYTNKNGTFYKMNDNYPNYETYEEIENTTREPDEISYDETTTRGYYGDRIYMSTQTPNKANDKTLPKNQYFVLRRTSDDDDIETIFE